MGYLFIVIPIMLASWYVSHTLKKKFEYYSKVHLRNGMSGAEIAQKMLEDHHIFDVKVISTPGRLTDHYNPVDKTVNLSEAVYNQRNAAAAAVAAHEVGHAVQHATAYQWLTMRSKLVPVVSVASGFSQWVIMGGIVLMAISNFGIFVALIGLAMMALGVLFSFITLPVEYDASDRALVWLKTKGMLGQQEMEGAKDALKWAAKTYLVAALGALATLVYYAYMILGRRD